MEIIARLINNRILRRIFGPKSDEDGEWRRLHSLYSSPNTVRIVKSRKLRLEGHVTIMEEGRNVFQILTGKPRGKRSLGVDERKIEWFLTK